MGRKRWTINSVEFVVLVVVPVLAVITCAVGLPLSGAEIEATKAVAPIINERTRALAIREAKRCTAIPNSELHYSNYFSKKDFSVLSF